MLVKTLVFSICGQGELTGPMPPCHGFEEYMQEYMTRRIYFQGFTVAGMGSLLPHSNDSGLLT